MHKDYEQSVNLLEERDSLSSHTGTALYPIPNPLDRVWGTSQGLFYCII